MTRSSRNFLGAGHISLGGMLLGSALAVAAEPASIPSQLVELGRQAVAQGRPDQARGFFEKALQLSPRDAEARRGLDAISKIRRASMRQDPAPGSTTSPADVPPADASQPPPATPQPPRASLERIAAEEKVREQQLRAYVAESLESARALLQSDQPEDALGRLRLLLESVKSESVDPAVRDALARQVSGQIRATVAREEVIEQTRAEQLRLAAAAAQTARAVAEMNRNEEIANGLMVQFDQLMAEAGYNVLYNGGNGDIAATTAPFYSARVIAQQARALTPYDPTAYAAYEVAALEGFLAQELAFTQLKEFRFLMTMQDVTRASVPFPDNLIIEYPPADFFRAITEKRIKRYESVSLNSRDEKTLAIDRKLEQTIPMPFAGETPLEDVIKYIKSATISPLLPEGIPIYVDPVGLQEAEKTMTSPVTLSLEGVALKRSLKLLLKQLELNYSVKDGLMTITHNTSKDQPTEIRVYPVADLALIPRALLGAQGGGGGMGGGMGGGGMGGGMGGGGMGGGMGGMGGGMGGGGMGGFGSIPPTPPQDPAVGQQKKSR